MASETPTAPNTSQVSLRTILQPLSQSISSQAQHSNLDKPAGSFASAISLWGLCQIVLFLLPKYPRCSRGSVLCPPNTHASLEIYKSRYLKWRLSTIVPYDCQGCSEDHLPQGLGKLLERQAMFHVHTTSPRPHAVLRH